MYRFYCLLLLFLNLLLVISIWLIFKGTFITEGYKGGILLEEVLASKAKVDKIVEALVKLCTHFIFDGWLVNIECRVPLGMMENL